MAETLKKYGIEPLPYQSEFLKLINTPVQMVRLRRAVHGESPYEPRHARKKTTLKWRMK